MAVTQERTHGVVEWFNPALGYGFVTTEDEAKGQIFVHYTELKQEGYRKLRKDQIVTFIEKPTEKGIQALEVEVLEDAQQPVKSTIEPEIIVAD